MNVVFTLEGDDEVVDWRAIDLIGRGQKLMDSHCSWQLRHASRICNRQTHLVVYWPVENDIPCGYVNHSLPLPSALCNHGGTVDEVCIEDRKLNDVA